MKKLVLTIGDPTGIGPEITVKALQRLGEFPDLKLTIIGSMKALDKAAADLRLPLPNYPSGVMPAPPLVGADIHLTDIKMDPRLREDDAILYLPIEAELPGDVAYQSIETAVKMIADKKADALVTGPISKKNLQDAGHTFQGHTEILEDLAGKYFRESGEIPSPLRGGLGWGSFSNSNIGNNGGSPPPTPPVKGGGLDMPQPQARRFKAEMLFVYKNFRLLLLTRHVALKDVPAELAKQGAVARPLKTLISYLRKQLDISDPHIAILAVNPHSGEVGGDEEAKYIVPVIKAVNAIGASTLAGPFPADGFFRDFSIADNPYHAIVAAYHDQGLIPFKLLAGHEAVNVTIGLPFLRTSVSHGTAEDIVGKGIAREDSLIAALHAALETSSSPLEGEEAKT